MTNVRTDQIAWQKKHQRGGLIFESPPAIFEDTRDAQMPNELIVVMEIENNQNQFFPREFGKLSK